MEYVILATAFLVIFLLITFMLIGAPSYNKIWINSVKNKSALGSKTYSFQDNGNILLDNKKEIIFVSAMDKNIAVYSNTDYINKFMSVFSSCPNVKVTFMEGYALIDNNIYYTYAYTKKYYDRLNKWMNKNGIFKTKDIWTMKKSANWKAFPTPRYEDINWSKKAKIGNLS